MTDPPPLQESPSSLRIVSLLPSATEMIAVVGLTANLVGRSHECDFPPQVTSLPILTRSNLPATSSCREINDAVTASLASGNGLYSVYEDLLNELAPDVIITQSLCDVCSVDLCVVEKIAHKMKPPPRVFSQNPQNIQEVLADVLLLGRELDVAAIGEAAHECLSNRIKVARERADVLKVARAPEPEGTNGEITTRTPTVLMMEWVDPVFVGGHWTPQIIHMAGAHHVLNSDVDMVGGGKSFAVENEKVVEADPDWILVCPCGYNMDDTKKAVASLEASDDAKGGWWAGLRAVREGRVVLIDGNQMFNRPGPRLVDCLEFVVGLIWRDESVIPKGFPYEMYEPGTLEAYK